VDILFAEEFLWDAPVDAFDGAKMRQGLAITGTASHFSASRPGSRSDARPQSSRGFRSRPQSSVKDAYKRTLVKNVLDNLVGQVEERVEAEEKQRWRSSIRKGNTAAFNRFLERQQRRNEYEGEGYPTERVQEILRDPHNPVGQENDRRRDAYERSKKSPTWQVMQKQAEQKRRQRVAERQQMWKETFEDAPGRMHRNMPRGRAQERALPNNHLFKATREPEEIKAYFATQHDHEARMTALRKVEVESRKSKLVDSCKSPGRMDARDVFFEKRRHERLVKQQVEEKEAFEQKRRAKQRQRRRARRAVQQSFTREIEELEEKLDPRFVARGHPHRPRSVSTRRRPKRPSDKHRRVRRSKAPCLNTKMDAFDARMQEVLERPMSEIGGAYHRDVDMESEASRLTHPVRERPRSADERRHEPLVGERHIYLPGGGGGGGGGERRPLSAANVRPKHPGASPVQLNYDETAEYSDYRPAPHAQKPQGIYEETMVYHAPGKSPASSPKAKKSVPLWAAGTKSDAREDWERAQRQLAASLERNGVF